MPPPNIQSSLLHYRKRVLVSPLKAGNGWEWSNDRLIEAVDASINGILSDFLRILVFKKCILKHSSFVGITAISRFLSESPYPNILRVDSGLKAEILFKILVVRNL